ncbi:hypothetical protein FRC01_006601, partial [Tulasnella sp. 417]
LRGRSSKITSAPRFNSIESPLRRSNISFLPHRSRRDGSIPSTEPCNIDPSQPQEHSSNSFGPEATRNLSRVYKTWDDAPGSGERATGVL